MTILEDPRLGIGFLVGGIICGAAFLLGASTGTGLKVGTCRTYQIDSTGDDWYIATSGRTAIVQFEPDSASTGTGTQVSVYGCTGESANQCSEYYFDSDDDGASDTYILTGQSWPLHERGIRIANVAGYILFDTTAYSDDAELVVCGAE